MVILSELRLIWGWARKTAWILANLKLVPREFG